MVKAELSVENARLARELTAELSKANVSAATTIQRAFHYRLSRVLQLKCQTIRVRAEEAEAESESLRTDLIRAQQATQQLAARTLQRSLRSAFVRTVRAAQGDLQQRELLKDERHLAESRHLERQLAVLRTEHNESKRKCTRLQRNMAVAEEGTSIYLSTSKQVYSAEIAHLEHEAGAAKKQHAASFRSVRSRCCTLALRLQQAAMRERELNEQVCMSVIGPIVSWGCHSK